MSTELEKRPNTTVENEANFTPPTGSEVPWWKQKYLRQLYLMMTFLFLGSTTLGYDGSVLNGLQTMTTFSNSNAQLRSSHISQQNVNRIREKTEHNPDNPVPMYLAGRFFIGFGANISNGTCPLLITEIAHPRHRGKVTTIYNTLWYLGAIVAAWTTYGTLTTLSGHLQWRLPTGLQCLMPGIQLLAIFFIPESPRWLISKGRDDEALKILTKYHANGDRDDEFVKWEFAEIRETLHMEKEAAHSSGWLELFRTPGNRKRSFLIIFTAIISQCSGNGLVSYYLSSVLKTIGITDSKKQALINGGLTIWCWLVSLACAFLVDRVGRRTLFLFSGVGMLISFTIWTACSAVYAKTGSTSAGSAVLAMIFLFYGTAGAAWPGLTVSYTVEILPFHIRAKGLTLCFMFTALSGVFNQYVNPIGLAALEWKFYFVYIAVLVIECLVIYFFYVETRGPTLEEIAILFDGPDSHVGGKMSSGMEKKMESSVEHVQEV
ncbi:related to hexose transporter protein [Phialocephala subalpina]|uniref:Related to hexose transporter protein n=1 Tax=Phialocephala subalpina TaxID=576137 RepID=A0A1L7XV76_9HELO|nr:related to hexose transporter protein [Phialocephala subalpina]